MSDKIEVILISDNHGITEAVDFIRNTYPVNDVFIHCGDSEMPKYMLHGFCCVNGNNDFFGEYPMRRVLEVGTHSFYICHGHQDMIFGHLEMLAERAKANDCDVVCFGHTHIYTDTVVDGIRMLNPGSMWHNRDASKPSYMVITVDGDEITTERKEYQRIRTEGKRTSLF